MTAPTRTTHRDQVRVGDIFLSSHGYRVLVTEVWDNAELRSDDRMIQFSGYLHAEFGNKIVTERYPASSTVEVEINTTPDQIAYAKAEALRALESVSPTAGPMGLVESARKAQDATHQLYTLARRYEDGI